MYQSNRHIRRREITQAIVEATEGLFSNVFDISLWFTAYIGHMSLPQSSVGQIYRAQIAADQFIEKINYETLKHGIAEARRRGFLKKIGRGRRALPEITKAGRRRLAQMIPIYDEKRIWDGRLHLVTYDIPEKRRADREIVREFLLKIGCGRLQDSVWITPYNPIDTLRSVIRQRGLEGTVIISDLGRDGSVGEESIYDLVVRIYRLEDLNKRYESWLDDIKVKGIVDRWSAISYLAILKNDPQLPFSILPSWWKGDEAYRSIKPKLKELSLEMRSSAN